MPLLSYIFWPNPASTTYDNPKVLVLLGVCAGLIVLSFVVRQWRSRMGNAVTRKLSKSWGTAFLWFGLVGLLLTVARVEQISYVSMRLWWLVWAAAFLLYGFLQLRRWKTMHYEVLPTAKVNDPRERYLPKRKK